MQIEGVEAMANVKITEPGGRVIEFSEISFDEARQLVSHNGNGTSRRAAHTKRGDRKRADYQGFKESLSALAKKFFGILRDNPNGISNEHLAEKLGFQSTNQIGGVTGGGIGKQATRFGISKSDLWVAEVTREAGQRRVVYRAGPEIEKVL